MNGELIKELRELEKSDQLPPRVSNRLILTAVIQLYDKVEQNSRHESRLKRLEGVTALLGIMWLAVVGWLLAAASA